MKIRMKISGSKVHGVGYRPWLTDVAINSGLLGFHASNRTEDKTDVVIVLAEGDNEGISFLEGQVRSSKPELAVVNAIDVAAFEGKVTPLETYAAINTTSQLNKAIPLLLGMNTKMDRMIEKQDQMLVKQDETISGIRDMRDDLVYHSNTERLTRIEKDIRVIKTRIGII
ncbi:Acylphosphatase [uncultured archaeon]|nr:Acylphosphatase [uncultured archaeon]